MANNSEEIIATFIEENDLESQEDAVRAYASLVGADFLESFQEAYQGEFNSDEDFARSIAADLGAIDKNASWPNNCIDWEKAAKELMYDYAEEGGYYFRFTTWSRTLKFRLSAREKEILRG